MMESYPKMYLYRRIVQAKLFIDQHFSEQIDLDNIADEAFFSKFHFLRLFKQVYGRTPHQYLTFVRIQKSKDLLSNKNITVSEVCFETGFESVASFTSLFKRHTGFTPSVFQKVQWLRRRESQHRPLQFVPHCFAACTERIEKSNFGEVVSSAGQ